jgi:hypoxia up-regulated 1
LALTLALSFTVSQCNVIGFDFGSQFFKITLVKPGQPFAIVENTATKRKTETMLTLNADDARIMGADSYMEQSKYPKTSFHSLHKFVGMSYSDPELPSLIKERYIMNEIKADERGFVAWVIKRNFNNGSDPVEEIAYTEELIGQLFKYGRQMSEK